MHQIVFYLAIIWTTLLFGVCVVFVIRAPSLMARILALDTLTLILIAFLVLFAHADRSAFYLDAALVLALLSFAGTLAAARYHSARRIF
jgi:multicomponent Na+:H+ antiporter subunit F